MEKTKTQFVAIDPMALLLPSSLYVKWIEAHHPHEPKVQDLATMLKQATPAEREDCIQRTNALAVCTRALQEAITSIK